jgi:hypothetical protein
MLNFVEIRGVRWQEQHLMSSGFGNCRHRRRSMKASLIQREFDGLEDGWGESSQPFDFEV